MRRLSSKQNVQIPDGDYPYGRIMDNPGNNTGTPFNESLYGDIQQFFERMFALSGIVANGFPDNVYTGFQLYKALLISARPYYSYTALVTQIGTNAPSPGVIVEDQVSPAISTGGLGMTVSWARISTGVYEISFSSPSPSVVIVIAPNLLNGLVLTESNTGGTGNVIIKTTDLTGTVQDGLFSFSPVEIRFYKA